MLSYRKIFPVFAEIHLPVATYPRIRTAQIIQPYRSSAFIHFGPQTFAQMLSTPGTVYPENLTWGYSRKFLENRKKKFLRTPIWVDFGTCKPISATTWNIIV